MDLSAVCLRMCLHCTCHVYVRKLCNHHLPSPFPSVHCCRHVLCVCVVIPFLVNQSVYIFPAYVYLTHGGVNSVWSIIFFHVHNFYHRRLSFTHLYIIVISP